MWVIAVAVANSFLVASAHSPRFIASFPVLVLLTAAGLRYSVPLLTRHSNRLITLLTVLIAAAQVIYYFGPHLDAFNQQIRLEVDSSDAVLRSLDFPPGTYIHLVGEFNGQYFGNMLGFFVDDLYLEVVPEEFFTTDYVDSLPLNADHAFYLPPDDRTHQDMLRRYFTLDPPQYTDNPDVPENRAYILYYARAENQ